MPRRPFLKSPHHYYHVTSRCLNREWFGIPIHEVWEIFENYLYFVGNAYSLNIASFVLMPNHYHMLLSAPSNNLSEAMNHLVREVSREICRESERINHVFGGRYYRSLITDEIYLRHAYKYIYRNPLKSNLSDRVEDYEFSTLSGVLGFRKLVVPVRDPILFGREMNLDSAISWLNRNPNPRLAEDVGIALRRPVFSFSRFRNKIKDHFLDANEF